MKLIFEHSDAEVGLTIPKSGVEQAPKLSKELLRDKEFTMPSLGEMQVIRHFSCLASKNFSVDRNFYPLGSCTMKYNPKFTERIASYEGFTNLHPYSGYLAGNSELFSGACQMIYELEQTLCEITGMGAFTLHPSAGAHGELVGVMIAKAHHQHNKDKQRTKVIVPDSSHGTNPASAAVCGYEVIVVPSDNNGCMDYNAYKEAINDEVALVMLTCPNTLGVLNPEIDKICDLAHQNGALVYYDGANLNAILGKLRPGDIGFDIVHVNLHKTFATPHGGGGPGSGPVGVSKELEKFLPVPRVVKDKENYKFNFDCIDSIGQITAFYGNFLVALKAYVYILLQGKEGLNSVSNIAVLNANYIKSQLKEHYDVSPDGLCMHECVFSADKQLKNGVSAMDIAKYLIDQGIHPPTVYFPLIVHEAMMVEPTETESKETLDRFIEIMIKIAELAERSPQTIIDTPQKASCKRFDETQAARKPILRWEKKSEGQ